MRLYFDDNFVVFPEGKNYLIGGSCKDEPNKVCYVNVPRSSIIQFRNGLSFREATPTLSKAQQDFLMYGTYSKELEQ